MPAPSYFEHQMANTRLFARALIKLTQEAEVGYAELYQASLSPYKAGDGGIPPGKQGFHVSDPTGDIAASGSHARMRSQVKRIASKLRRCEPILEEANQMIEDAFSEFLDPAFREKLAAMRHDMEESA
jgi:hypothetical protein